MLRHLMNDDRITTSCQIVLHPKLIIVNHFDSVINLIDIRAEYILNELKGDGCQSQINKIRNEYLGIVKALEKSCLKNLELNYDLFLAKLCKIDEQNLTDGEKASIAEHLKCKLFADDYCFLVTSELFKKKLEFGVKLIVTNWYLNENTQKCIQ